MREEWWGRGVAKCHRMWLHGPQNCATGTTTRTNHSVSGKVGAAPTYRMNGCFSANRMLSHTAEPMGRVTPTAAQPKVSYLALPRRKARKASERHRLSSMSLQARLDAKSAWAPRDDLWKVLVSVDTRRRAACATRRRALARAAPSHPSSPLRSPNSRLIFPLRKSCMVGTSDRVHFIDDFTDFFLLNFRV